VRTRALKAVGGRKEEGRKDAKKEAEARKLREAAEAAEMTERALPVSPVHAEAEARGRAEQPAAAVQPLL
jgi:hypothetical protein